MDKGISYRTASSETERRPGIAVFAGFCGIYGFGKAVVVVVVLSHCFVRIDVCGNVYAVALYVDVVRFQLSCFSALNARHIGKRVVFAVDVKVYGNRAVGYLLNANVAVFNIKVYRIALGKVQVAYGNVLYNQIVFCLNRCKAECGVVVALVCRRLCCNTRTGITPCADGYCLVRYLKRCIYNKFYCLTGVYDRSCPIPVTAVGFKPDKVVYAGPAEFHCLIADILYIQRY